MTSPQIGSVVLQKDAPTQHPVDRLIALKSPHYAHCGIVVDMIGDVPVMVASSLGFGGVDFQSVRALGKEDIEVQVRWSVDFSWVKKWLISRIGLPYDLGAYWYALIGRKAGITGLAYDCSTLVGSALNTWSAETGHSYRCTTPDDIARILGVLK